MHSFMNMHDWKEPVPVQTSPLFFNNGPLLFSRSYK